MGITPVVFYVISTEESPVLHCTADSAAVMQPLLSRGNSGIENQSWVFRKVWDNATQGYKPDIYTIVNDNGVYLYVDNSPPSPTVKGGNNVSANAEWEVKEFQTGYYIKNIATGSYLVVDNNNLLGLGTNQTAWQVVVSMGHPLL